MLAEPVHMSKCAHVSMFTCALGKMKALQFASWGGQSAATTVPTAVVRDDGVVLTFVERGD